jgi:hypothetical protein
MSTKCTQSIVYSEPVVFSLLLLRGVNACSRTWPNGGSVSLFLEEAGFDLVGCLFGAEDSGDLGISLVALVDFRAGDAGDLGAALVERGIRADLAGLCCCSSGFRFLVTFSRVVLTAIDRDGCLVSWILGAVASFVRD